MDLFSHSAREGRIGQPLAERMRPRSLEEVVGQGHLLGPDRLLSRAAAAGELPSIILWGPPGTGKTTLARILATRIGALFEPLSAVMSGVRELRAAVARASEQLSAFRKKTLLFIDEIHRFSRAQQDALLPHVEAGTVIFVGATTENPSFEVVAPLLSRCRVLRLEPLSEGDLRVLVDRALGDSERGLGRAGLTFAGDAVDACIAVAAGDARRLFGILEAAAAIAGQGGHVTRAVIDEAAQQRTLLYDRAGDEHYGVVSAFIKSLRGSDPDAAVYWMARMLEAGEDPRFVIRRLVIFASEDIGNADPQALSVATSALAAFELVGLPEGVLPLTQAAIYLACAPKSNSVLTTYAAARRAVSDGGALPVPDKLRNAPTALAKKLGHGRGYKYPHNFEGHYVAETYLPDKLAGARFYRPSSSGDEVEMGRRLQRWHDAAKRETDNAPGSSDPDDSP